MHGKTVWVIGASEGIGAALSIALAKAGAQLVLSARNAERLEDVRETLPGTNHRTIPLDACSPQSISAAWQELAASPPDITIYNAGAYTPMDARHMDMAAIETMIDVNLRGAFRIVSTVLPAYLARNRGHLVLVGSVAGYRGLPSAIGYGASKAGLIHLAENLRADLKATGIQVQVVNPGFVRTRLTDKNAFRMPCIISTEASARHILNGLRTSCFEIHFPKRFTLLMKLLALLPNGLYYRLVS